MSQNNVIIDDHSRNKRDPKSGESNRLAPLARSLLSLCSGEPAMLEILTRCTSNWVPGGPRNPIQGGRPVPCATGRGVRGATLRGVCVGWRPARGGAAWASPSPVYGAKDEDGGHRAPDPVRPDPRIIPAPSGRSMESRFWCSVTALNRFIHDVYHGQEILGWRRRRAGAGNAQFRAGDDGADVPNIYSAHRRHRHRACARRHGPAASTTCWRTTCACPAA